MSVSEQSALDNIIENEFDDMEDFDEGNLSDLQDRKLILEKADRSLSELNRWHKNGKIIVDPEWQRNFVWDKTRSSKLIESFLVDIPVPVIYLAKREDGKYEVVDGLQRLTTIFKFLDNDFKLQNMEIIPEINNKYFKDLDLQTQGKLEDAVLRSFELASGSGDMHFIVFERINTGSVKLNDMEIRNCLYRGSLNNLLKELSVYPEFVKALNQKRYAQRMQDRSLVLRGSLKKRWVISTGYDSFGFARFDGVHDGLDRNHPAALCPADGTLCKRHDRSGMGTG